MTKRIYISYRTAVNWLNGNLILCNDIPQIDDSIWDEMRFDLEDEEGCCDEIFQFFLTSYNGSDVEWLEKTFGLTFTYSNLLNLYILCVTHFGTSWDAVPVEVLDPEWIRVNGDNHTI